MEKFYYKADASSYTVEKVGKNGERKPIRKVLKDPVGAMEFPEHKKEKLTTDNDTKAKIWIHNNCQKRGVKEYSINDKLFKL